MFSRIINGISIHHVHTVSEILFFCKQNREEKYCLFPYMVRTNKGAYWDTIVVHVEIKNPYHKENGMTGMSNRQIKNYLRVLLMFLG